MDSKEKPGPNFLLIGAGKSATTSIAAQIAQHPDVFVTTPKEPHYFSFEYAKGPSWYLSLFEGSGACQARGEASVTYSQVTQWPGVAERILNDIGPDCRFIYIMRHPVHGLVSHIFHDLSRGHIPLGSRIQDQLVPGSRYIDARRYGMQIAEYLKYFRKENFLFLTYEDYRSDPQRTLAEIFRFLEVDDAFMAADMAPRNVSAGQVRKPAWYRMLRSLRGERKWLRLPAPLQSLSRRMAASGSRAVPRPELTAEEMARVWALVADDVERLSRTIGRDMRQFWDPPVAGGGSGVGRAVGPEMLHQDDD